MSETLLGLAPFSQCKADISPESALVLGTKSEQKQHKQHETDMPNTNLSVNLANTNYIPPVLVWSAMGRVGSASLENLVLGVKPQR